jgi:hypothetical protein
MDFCKFGGSFCTLVGMACIVGAINSTHPCHHFPKVGVPSSGAAGTLKTNRENAPFLRVFFIVQICCGV